MKVYGRKLISIVLAICLIMSVAPAVIAEGVHLEQVPGIQLWPTNVDVDGIIDDTVSYSGSCSYKVINHTPQGPMKYFVISWAANVTAGNNYSVGGKFKADNISEVSMILPGDEKISITKPFGKTYDWQNVEVDVLANTTGQYRVMVMLESNGTMWFDDLFIIDKETGENLIQNGDFELKKPEDKKSDSIVKSVQVNGDFNSAEEYQEQLEATLSQKTFKAEELEKFNNPGAVPIYKADGISMDTSGKGWEKYKPFIMTIPTTNYVDYMNQGSDINGEIKVAFDDDSFYIHAIVNDDIFCPKIGADNYWSGDGVQITFSEGDVFGKEIGVAWNSDEDKANVYSVYLKPEQLEEISADMAVEEGRQIYDVTVPWDIIFDNGKPERFRFNMCFNDCDDGVNRHDCMEISYGILISKSSVNCPELELMDGGRDWYTWFDAEKKGYQNTKIPGKVWIVNNSEQEKEFSIISEQCGIYETVTVAPLSGILYEYSYDAQKAGSYHYDISVKHNDYVRTNSVSVMVSYPDATEEEAKELVLDCQKWAEELNVLAKQCEDKGIDIQYDKISIFTVNDFAYERIQEDIDKKLFYRIGYWREKLSDIYETTKSNLNSYLSGAKTPITAPVYTTSKIAIDGSMFYADTEWDGVKEKRPVIFSGYVLHYPLVESGLEDMPRIGANSIALEYTLGTAIKNANTCEAIQNHWPNNVTGAAKRTTDEAHSGKYSYFFSKTNPVEAGSYRHIRTYCPTLKPNTKYTYSFWEKAENANGLVWSISGGEQHSISGTHDWTEQKQTFKTGPEQTSVTFDHILSGQTTGVYYDDISLVEENTEENLIPDGDFEYVPEEFFELGYYVNRNSLKLDEFEAAERNNQSVDLLLDLGHNIPQFIFDTFPETRMQSNGFNIVNFASPKYREIAEKYIRYMMENLKDFKCLHTVDLANEVQINTYKYPDLYLPRFRKWLMNRYGSIETLNSAYNAHYSSFDEIGYPESFTGDEPVSVDFDEYSDWELADFHRFAANIVHEYRPDVGVYTKIMDYNQDYGNAHVYSYHYNGTGLDAYANVFNVNGCDAYSYLDWDRGRLVKMQWYDYMASINFAPIVNGEDHILKDSGMNYSDELADFVSADLWQGAVHYRGKTEAWLWDSREEEDITKGSIKCRPDAIIAEGETSLDLMRLSYEIEALQKEHRDVGILYSNASAVHNTSYPGCQYYAYEAASFAGTKVKYVSENNILGIHDTRLLIIPQCMYVKPNTLIEIRNYINNGGKVVIIGKNSLKYTEHFSDSDSELVDYIYSHSDFVGAESDRFKQGLTEGNVEDIRKTIFDAIQNAGINYVTLIDADTGEIADEVEYQSTVYNGKLLINICNRSEGERRLKAFVKGKEVTGFTELRSGDEIDGDITAKYLKPILISADWSKSCFLDMIGHWACDSVSALYEKGVIKGVTETRYEPERQITRAEYLSLLVRACGLKGQYRNQISDVPFDAWYSDNIAAALEAGIILRENFRPCDIITRDEVASLTAKALEYKNVVSAAGDNSFTDRNDIVNFEAVSKLVSLGIIVGYEDGSFKPNRGLTRGETAAVIERLIDKIN